MTTLTVTDFAATVAENQPLPERCVVLTFDDTFVDFATHAVPVLEQFNVRSTVYIPTAYVGDTSRWMQSISEGDRPVLDWDALNQLPSSVECGAHSHTHPQLDLVSLFGAEVKVRYFYLTSSVGRPNITTDQFARLLTQQSTRVERQLRSIAASGWRQVRRIRTRLEN